MKKRKLVIVCGIVMVNLCLISGCGSKNTASAESKAETKTEVQTEAKKSEAKNLESTKAVKESKKIQLSEYSTLYKGILETIQKKYNEYCMYSLYDIDGDGIYELITTEGTCDADYRMKVYTYNGTKVVDLGELSIGSSMLYKEKGQDGLIAVYGQMGYQKKSSIKLENNKVKVTVLSETQLKAGEEYYSTPNPIQSYEVNNYIGLSGK